LRAQATLRAETNDRDLLHAELRRLAEQLGKSLRLRRVTADRLELVARYADHRDAVSATPLEPATDLDVELTAAARALADRLLVRRIALSALGLTVLLGPGSDVQLSLFGAPPPALCRRSLNAALDRVRRRYGTTSIRYAR
jgi:hypothetical protein